MRPEKKLLISKTPWRSGNQFIKRQISNLTVFRAALIFSLLAGLALSFSLNPSLVTTAQEQKPVSEQEILINAQPEGIGEINPEPSMIASENGTNSPDGSVCTWNADTVYPINVQDHAVAVAGNTLYSFAGQSNSVFTANSYRFNRQLGQQLLLIQWQLSVQEQLPTAHPSIFRAAWQRVEFSKQHFAVTIRQRTLIQHSLQCRLQLGTMSHFS